MLAQRCVEQEYRMVGKRPRGLSLELRPNAGIEITRSVVALPAADRLNLSAGREASKHDFALRFRVVPGVAINHPAAASFLFRLFGQEHGLREVRLIGLQRE